jgi:hypothetical protein
MPENAGAAEPWEVGEDRQVSPTARVVATAPERTDRRAVQRERRWRWLFVAALALFLALALAGVFGLRTATASSAGGGYEMRVTYARITRPGLATPLDVEVARRDGASLDGPVEVAVSAHYLAMFDDLRLPVGGHAGRRQARARRDVALRPHPPRHHRRPRPAGGSPRRTSRSPGRCWPSAPSRSG